MTTSQPDDSKLLDDPEFQELLVECLEKLQRGERIDREALLAKHPEYGEELNRFLEDRELLIQRASALRDAAGSQFLRGNPLLAETVIGSGVNAPLEIGERVHYVGEYEILAELARGGMGVVYKARQQKLKRVVALKMILSGRLASQDDVSRFQREAQASARLKHPRIVPIHEIGEHEGQAYFTMDFVKGESLANLIRDEALAPQRAAELMFQVAEAIHYAHQQGIVHRDLKPANILLDESGEPHVTDFGLAKIIAADPNDSRKELTLSGQILGTPSYMSPEQASGTHQLVGPATDVYSLGAILYASLTSRAPFVAESTLDTIRQVTHNEPLSPRTLNPKIPRDLETICLKCLEKEPHKRYGTAGLLADDLKRFREGRPVIARPVGRFAKLWRWSRRNRTVSGLLAAIVLSLLVGLGATFWQWRSAQANLEDAIEARGFAEQSQQETEAALKSSESRLARVYVERGLQKVDVDPHSGLPWLFKALKTEPEDSSGRQMHRLRLGLMLREIPALLGFWPGAVDAKFSEDGTMLAIAAGNEVVLFELPTMTQIGPLKHRDPVVGVYFTHQGDRLATVSRNGSNPPICRLWHTRSGKPATEVLNLKEAQYGLRDTPTIHFTPNGDRFTAVYAGMYNRWHSKMATRIFDSRTLKQVSPTFAHHSDLDYMDGYHELSPDALRVLVSRGVTADHPGVAWIDPDFPKDMEKPQQYDLLSGKPMHPPLDHKLDFYLRPVYSVDGSLIATSDKGVVKVWDGASGAFRKEFALSTEESYARVQFHPDGTSLFAVERGKAYWWDIATGNLKKEWVHVDKFQVDPTGRYRVYQDPNGEHYIQDLTSANANEGKLPDLYRVRFCPDGSRFILDPSGYREAGLYVSPPEQVFRSADQITLAPPWRFTGGNLEQPFSKDGRFFLAKDGAGIWLWDLDQRKPLVESFPPNQDSAIIDAAMSHDRQRLAVLTEDLTVSCWNTETGHQSFPPFKISAPANSNTRSEWESLSLSAAGDRIAILGEYEAPTAEDQTREVSIVQVWNLEEGQPLFDPLIFDTEKDFWIGRPRFINNDNTLVVPEYVRRKELDERDQADAHDSTRLHRFDTATGKPIGESREFAHTLNLLCFTSDRKRCLVVCESHESSGTAPDAPFAPYAQIFSTDSWKPLTPPMTPEKGFAWNAKLSPDGTRVVVGNGEVWDALTGLRLVPAVVSHRDVNEIVLHDDGRSFIAVIDHSDSWDRTTEIRHFAIDGTSLSPPMINTRTGESHCAIHPAQRIVAAAGHGLRFWDADHGSALSPAIDLPTAGTIGRNQNDHRSTFFSPCGSRLYIEDGGDITVIRWNEITGHIPSDDVLEVWSGILSGHRVEETGGVVPLRRDEYQEAWNRILKAGQE